MSRLAFVRQVADVLDPSFNKVLKLIPGPDLHPVTRHGAVMTTLGASIRQACAVSTHGMTSDPQFSHSYLAGAAALAQLQRSLRERYSLEVQVRFVCCLPPVLVLWMSSTSLESRAGVCLQYGSNDDYHPILLSPVLHLLRRGPWLTAQGTSRACQWSCIEASFVLQLLASTQALASAV